MNGARIYRFLLLVAAMALATIALGWVGVPMVAAVFVIMDRHPRVPAETAWSAACAWALLFGTHSLMSVAQAVPGPSIIRLVSGAMGVPAIVPPLVTIVFPALLAWSAATVAGAAAWLVRRPRAATPAAQR